MTKRRCPATSKRTGEQCKRWLAPGAVVCKWHGGGSPQALAAQDRRVRVETAEGDLGRLLAAMGEESTPHPLDGLPQAYRRAHLMVLALGALVAELDTPLGLNRFEEWVVHPLVALQGEWLDRYVRIQKLTLDADLDERHQQLEEADVAELLRVFQEAVAAAGLIPAQQEAFETHVALGLRRLSAG